MNEMWIIFKREFLARVVNRTFLISTLLFPIIMTGMIAIQTMASGGSSQRTLALIDEAPSGIADRFTEVLASVRSGEDTRYRIERVAGTFASQADELNRRVLDKRIDGYVVLPADIMVRNEVLYRARNISSLDVNKDLQLAANRAVQAQRLHDSGIEAKQLLAIIKPVQIDSGAITKDANGKGSAVSSFLLAYGVAFLIYFSIIMQGIGLLRSVLEEKTNRISEVMMSSVRPGYMMAGKIFGAGSAALVQVGIWLMTMTAGAIFMKSRSVIPPEVLSSLSFDAGTTIIFFAYFILGFFLYAGVFAALGSMVNSEQEAQSIQSFAILPLVVPLLFMRRIIDDPLGQTATTLGLVPFTSPIAMPMRMASETLSFMQVSLSLACLVLGLIAVTWIAGRIYRIGILSTGKKPSFAELLKWIRAK